MIRIIFFGTPEFSVPFLRALSTDPAFEVVAVVTRPDTESGRGKALAAPPVKIAAEAAGIPVLQPSTLKSNEILVTLAAQNADAFVVFAYGRIIPKDVLDLPRLGCVNVHPSLLPAYRGPSPMQSAIRNGDATTGITIMLLDEGMDTGALLASVNVSLDADETLETLTKKVEEQGPALLIETIRRLAAGEIVPVPQDESRATMTKLLSRDDGRVDWTLPLAEIERMVRAYHPWPGTWTVWKRGGKELRLKLLGVTPADFKADVPPGTASIKNSRLFVDCSDGTLEILRLQPEGKDPMDAATFLRGYSDVNAAVLA